MKLSTLAFLAWAACAAATPVSPIHQRGLEHHKCDCGKDIEVPHEPAPEPAPEPVPEPVPEQPAPAPEPAPEPAPAPAPEPAPAPAPEPEPEPAPAPAPAPEPVPEQPAPEPQPEGPKEGCDKDGCRGTGHLIQDLGHPTNKLLHVVGLHTEELLIKLSPGVEGLLSGLGLGVLGKPVGSIVKEASSIGELVADLGDPIECLLVVLGQDTGYLLVQLEGPVSGLLSGLGLKTIAGPVGQVVGTVGEHLKRGEPVKEDGLLEDVAPVVNCLLQIIGIDSKILLVELSGPVAEVFNGLGLEVLGGPVGEVIEAAGEVGELVKDLGPVVECLLTIIGYDGGVLLIQLSDPVAALVSGLLPEVGPPVGKVVKVLGENL